MDERSALPAIALTDAEQRLLDAIRAGMPDAEIAVRLGISNAEVKARTERLAAKLGVEGRSALLEAGPPRAQEVRPADKESPSRPGHLTRAEPILLIAIIVLCAAAGVWWLTRDANDSPAGRVSTEIPMAAPTAGSPVPRLTVINGREMYDLGSLFKSETGTPVAESESREAASVVTLQPGAQLEMVSPLITWVVFGAGPNVIQARGTLRSGETWQLAIWGDQTTIFAARLPGGPERPASIPIYTSAADGHPRVLVMAFAPDGEVPDGVSARYPLMVDNRGHLLLSPKTLLPGVIIDGLSGEAIDAPLSSFRQPFFAKDYFRNSCNPAGCNAVVAAEPLLAPARGHYSCDPATRRMFLAGFGFVLHFESVKGLEETPRPCPEQADRDVEADDPIGPGGLYSVTASQPDGQPLSVAVTEGGTLVWGTFAGAGDCPCALAR
jgi:DNA-binding CsgD family transcriptional regulator